MANSVILIGEFTSDLPGESKHVNKGWSDPAGHWIKGGTIMKPNKASKKLQLCKETVDNLDKKQLNKIQGGNDSMDVCHIVLTENPGCYSVFICFP
jgi:hypothetical protein